MYINDIYAFDDSSEKKIAFFFLNKDCIVFQIDRYWFWTPKGLSHATY